MLYDSATGDLDAADQAGTAEDLPVVTSTRGTHRDAGAMGVVAMSPGVASGNVIPLHVPINLCGNTIDIIALLNAASGNTCINKS
ncbi:chaplin [Kitasatospora sp. NPDC098663]|uniref:chaplin n=1 Tax=Kitasatospora sp. NPDC098663 TaxID=3364096 RepID=UPI003801C435